MTTRRVRGASLGLVIILVNILLVAVLVMATSSRSVTDLFNPDDAAPTTGERPEPDAVQDSSTSTASPTLMPPTRAEIATDDAPDLSDLFADGEDLTVVVLGDQTGADPADWVRAWAELLASERTVDYLTPTASDPTVYGDPVTLGDGESSISIYNASLVGGTPGYAAERLDLYLPSGTDVVLLNFGRSNTEDDLEEHLDELWSAVEEESDAEIRTVVQPPRQDGLAPLTGVTREWAEDADAPIIDVAEIFADEGLTELTVSTRDPLSVNLAGAARWAQIVQTAVFDVELAPVGGPTPPEILPPTLPAATQPPVGDLPVDPLPVDPLPVDPPVVDPPPYTPPEPTYNPPAPTYDPPAPTYNPPAPTTPSPPPAPTTPPPTSDPPEPTTEPTLDPTAAPTPTIAPDPLPDPTEPTQTWDPDPGPDNLGVAQPTLADALRGLLLRP